MTPSSPSAAPARERRTTLVFLAAVLLHGLAYLFAVSPWMGEDEPWHFEYASYVADGHSPWRGRNVVTGPDAAHDERRMFAPSVLQVRAWRFGSTSYETIETRERAILASMRDADFFRKVDWAGALPQRRDFDSVAPMFTAATQPPLYYLLLGAWLAPVRSLALGTQLAVARCSSLALYVLTAWLGLLFARRVFSDPTLSWCAAFFVAWLPMHARQAALVNNDVLARTWATLLLLIAARVLARETRPLELLAACGVAALSLATKSTTAGAVCVLAAAFVLSRTAAFVARARREQRWSRAKLLVVLAGVLVLGAAALWLGHRSPVIPKSLAAFEQRVANGFSRDTLAQTWRTLVGSFNWYSRDFPSYAYALAAVVAACAAAGVVAVLARERAGVSRAHVALCAVAVGAQIALVVLRGVGHGRYVMPAVAAFGALAVAGLVAPWPQRWRARAAGALCVALAVYDALFLWGGLVPNEYLAWGS
jgi:hypothetical protein